MREKMDLEIRSILTGDFVPVEFDYNVPDSLIHSFYRAFQPTRLKGAVMMPLRGQGMLAKAECRDYADDYAYDEQQCRAYFSKRMWEDFDLKDAAFLLGYLHVFPRESFYSAVPFIFEVALAINKWIDALPNLVSRLRDDAKSTDQTFAKMLTPEITQAIIDFLELLQKKAEGFEKYEDVTVIERTIRLWKDKL
jgi:hypothetical protein